MAKNEETKQACVVLYLVSNGKNRLGLWSDKVDSGISARPGKVSVLGQETVTYHE